MATSIAEKPLLYACRSTIIRTAPSVIVNSRYVMEMMTKGNSAPDSPLEANPSRTNDA